MSRYFSSMVVPLLLLSSVAHAEEKSQTAEKVEGKSEASATAIPTAQEYTGSRLESSVDPNLQEKQAAPVPGTRKPDNAAISAELIDGQQVIFRENGYVSIVTERGSYITPPDGILTLKDGTTFSVKDGLRVDE